MAIEVLLIRFSVWCEIVDAKASLDIETTKCQTEQPYGSGDPLVVRSLVQTPPRLVIDLLLLSE